MTCRPQKSAAKKLNLHMFPRKEKLHNTEYTATITLTLLS